MIKTEDQQVPGIYILTMVISHLVNGMILQAVQPFSECMLDVAS